MSLIILEGMDRVGKTSVAQLYESQGYQLIHMSAPPKGQTSDLFLEEMMEIVASAASKDIILDRSYYGELIWSKVYGRESLLDDQGLEVLQELEQSVGTVHILMHDPNTETHWQRCVDNKEPLTKTQFVKARTLYSTMADKYGFERKTLKDFPNAVQPLPPKAKDSRDRPDNDSGSPSVSPNPPANKVGSDNSGSELNKTKEQQKLERANVINEILSKRLIKGKGPVYDELERSVRHFLNNELGKIFGNNTSTNGNFSVEEIELLKFFCQRLKEKEEQ